VGGGLGIVVVVFVGGIGSSRLYEFNSMSN